MNKEDYFKYYIQNSDHYLIPKDVFNELFSEMVNWREETKELKQKYLNAVADYETTMSELQELKADYGNKAQVERDLLKEENQELKSQLKGTTHCFDEEEHERLKFEKEQLNSLVNSCQEEIRQLKKQLEKLEKGE